MSTPVQEQCEIFSVQQAGEYLQFTCVAPKIASGAKPGQFVAVGVGGENTAMLLRRAFALYSAKPAGDFAGTIQFVVAEHGAGTRWLTRARTGDVLDIVGPLGTPFPLPSGPAPRTDRATAPAHWSMVREALRAIWWRRKCRMHERCRC